jgi:hypothetical protein
VFERLHLFPLIPPIKLTTQIEKIYIKFTNTGKQKINEIKEK